MTFPLGVDLGNSLESFRHGAEEFFHRLGDIGWPSMVIALAFYLAHLLAPAAPGRALLQPFDAAVARIVIEVGWRG